MPLDQVDVDNLPAEKEMSFLEHLEELRWHIVRAIVCLLYTSPSPRDRG